MIARGGGGTNARNTAYHRASLKLDQKTDVVLFKTPNHQGENNSTGFFPLHFVCASSYFLANKNVMLECHFAIVAC